MIYIVAYLLVGVVVAGIILSRRKRPREKEIGNLLFVLTDPLMLWLPLLLWPLWLVLMAIPERSFIEEKMPESEPPENFVGRTGVVVFPLTPVGRIAIDGVHRDARAEFGEIPKGASVIVCAHGIGSELVVKETKPATPTSRAVHDRADLRIPRVDFTQYLPMRYLVTSLLLMITLNAAEAGPGKERTQRISAEVERRRSLREQAAAALENARKVVRDHESGAKIATDAELAAARETVRRAEPRNGPMKPGDSASLSLPEADMDTIGTAWRTLFGGSVTIAERAKARGATIKIPATPRDELRKKLIASLREHGIYVIERPDGVIFDLEPDRKQGK